MRPVREKARAVSYREPNESEVYRDADPDELAASDRRGKKLKIEGAKEVEGRGGRRRAHGKEIPLDAIAIELAPVPGAEEYSYSLGGAEIGGVEADRILGEVEADESIIKLTSQFSTCRRIVLFQQGRNGPRAVAAAVIELHLGGSASGGVLEVPILASARAMRGQGHGSVLVALLVELASIHLAFPSQGIIPQGSQGAVAMLVSSTDEARRFWLTQECLILSNCPPAVRDAIRGLNQRGGQRFGHFHTTSMARELPDGRVVSPSALPGAVPKQGVLVTVAIARYRARLPHTKGLSAAKAAEMFKYEDLPPGGSYFVAPGVGRTPLSYAEPEGRSVHVPLSRLQAFPVVGSVPGHGGWGTPGYGVRSTVPIRGGQTVIEVCGRWISDEEHEELPLRERGFCIGLDERARALRRAAGDDKCWLDLHEVGSLARMVRECNEAPNLELVLHPDPASHGVSAGSPFRLYFVAKHDIPSLAELVWERPTLVAGRRGRGAASAPSRNSAVASTPCAPTPSAAAAFATPRSSGPVVEGSLAEARSSDRALEGARFGVTVLAAGRTDGLFRVRYMDLFLSPSSEEPLTEWVEPKQEDELRPPPPLPPDGFHSKLREGDEVDLLFEGAWWPVSVCAVHHTKEDGTKASSDRTFEVESRLDSTRFSGLSCRVSAARIRPNWKWEGRADGKAGRWTFQLRSHGWILLDPDGKPYPAKPAPTPVMPPQRQGAFPSPASYVKALETPSAGVEVMGMQDDLARQQSRTQVTKMEQPPMENLTGNSMYEQQRAQQARMYQQLCGTPGAQMYGTPSGQVCSATGNPMYSPSPTQVCGSSASHIYGASLGQQGYGASGGQYGASGDLVASGNRFGASACQYGASGSQCGSAGSHYGISENQYSVPAGQYGVSAGQYGASGNQMYGSSMIDNLQTELGSTSAILEMLNEVNGDRY